jgi:hypothetical protein
MELIKEAFAYRWAGPVDFNDGQCTLVRDEVDGRLDEARALLRTLGSKHVPSKALESVFEELIEDGLHYTHYPHAYGDDNLDTERE